MLNDALREAVSRLLAAPVEHISQIRRDPVDYDAFLAGRTLTRISGTAAIEGRGVAWSLVEKLTDGPPQASRYLYDNGARELAAYRSGLLEDLAPGLVAPRLVGSAVADDGALTLWLEDVGPRDHALTDDAVLAAARELGRLGGRWLGKVPDGEWLFRGWIERHAQTPAMPGGLAIVHAARSRPEIEARIGRPLDQAAELIHGQDRYRAILESLPETLCHHDAVASNVFRRERNGATETVLIDWESLGPGPLGADLASLLFSSARRGDLSARALPRMMAAAFDAYVTGVTEMGAHVGVADLHRGLYAAIALRWALVRDVLRAMVEDAPARRGSAPQESREAALDELILLTRILLDSAGTL